MSIDYGNGVTNIDLDTGIRYGVIGLDKVLQAWADSCDCDCGEGDPDDCCDFTYYLDDGEYQAEQWDSFSSVAIFKSPYFTMAKYCSPCIPGAGDLDHTPGPCKCYCFGHDWFDGEQAPYKVYSVDTGKEVLGNDDLIELLKSEDKLDYLENNIG